MKFRRTKKVLLIFLIAVCSLILLLIISINLPFGQRFITGRINNILADAGLPIHITEISKIFPEIVTVKGITISGIENDTIIYAGEIKAGFLPLGLLKKKLIIKSVDIIDAKVSILRKGKDLNIAAAFSQGNKDSNNRPEQKKKSWLISIGEARISSARFQMNDSLSGIQINQHLGELFIKMDRMSLPDHDLSVHTLDIRGANGTIKIISHPASQDTSSSTAWNIGVNNIELFEINQVYNNAVDSQLIGIVLGESSVSIDKMDIENRSIAINKILFDQASLIFKQGTKPAEKDVPVKDTTSSFTWNIEADRMDLKNISFETGKYSDSIPEFGVKELDLEVSDLVLNDERATIKIDQSLITLNNGFMLKKLIGSLNSDDNETSLELSAETSNSTFNIESKADGKLFQIISDPSRIRKAFVSVMNTELSVKDLLCFKPELRKINAFNSLEKSPLILNINASLSDSVISIIDVSLEKKKSMKTVITGNIINAFFKNKEKGEINLNIPFIDFQWIKSLLDDSDLKNQLPEIKSLSLSGSISGSLKSSLIHLAISSNLGNTDITGTIEFDNDSIYAKTIFSNVMAGKLISNPLLGSFDGSIEIAGKGIRKKEPSGKITLIIDSLGFKDYVYTNTRLEGKIESQKYEVQLNIDDPFLKCNLSGSVNTSDSSLDIQSAGRIFAQLNRLKLLKDTLEIDGKIKADFKKVHSQIQSDLLISDLKIITPKDNSVLSETKVEFNSDSVRTLFNARCDLFDVNVQVEKPVNEFGTILPAYKQYAKTFIDYSLENISKRTSLLPELRADIKINPNKAIGLIFNDSTFNFSDFNLKIINNPVGEKMFFNLNGNNIEHKGFKIGYLNSMLTDSAGNLEVLVSAESLSFLSKHLDKILIASHFSKKQGFTDFKIFEKQDKILYDFGINTIYDSTGIAFSVPQKELTLNGVNWKMDTPDLFMLSRNDKKFLISFNAHTDSSYFRINSFRSEGMQTKLEMNRVDIGSILPVNLFQSIPTAVISGNLSFYSGQNNEKELNSELKINNISWADIRIDLMNLKSEFKSEKPEDYTAELTATLDSSAFNLKIINKNTGTRKINAEIMNLNLKSFQPFAKKYVSDLKGGISGKLNIQTSDSIKKFDGELDLKEATVRINALNSLFKIPSDKILFTGNKIIFESFRVLDSLDHELLVEGSLNFIKSGLIISDMNVSSKNLQVMKSNETENSTFFGDIFVDSRLTIKGPVSSPDLKGNIKLAEGTEIFFREKENLNLTETEKVLTFVNRSAKSKDNGIKAENAIYSKSSIDALVRIDPATRINFQLSKRLFSIDLMIQGGGELSYDMMANQETNLSGTYEISDGTTDVKITGWPNKAFRITKGGYVRWDGKVNDPVLNFEAVSRVRSSYVNPVDNQQRQTDFNVTLKLANRLSALDLLFTINTPDQYLMSIINTLSPEEQMKQAITILLFGKVDLPGISTSSDYMTEQVNQLVASQLNQLTKTTISGLDISFGIDSYVQATQSGGQETKTSLSYEVKKDLLNNRAQIEVSGRINDDSNKQSGGSDLSLNNVSFEYRLDSAGTIFLKVYNEHTYEDVFEGEVVKTGVGLVYRKTYARIVDIWKKENREENKKQSYQDK